MNPFIYAKRVHRRSIEPEPETDYRKYKSALKAEFGSQCVYCRLPDGWGGSFGVDHYQPKSLFPAAAADYRNLFYACNGCNSRKGNFWPAPADLKAKRVVLNPCDHVMSAHVNYVGAEVLPRTKTGSFFSDHLLLNDTRSVAFRETMQRAIALNRKEWHQTRADLGAVTCELRRTQAAARRQELFDYREDLKNQLGNVESDLARLCATAADRD